MYTFAHPNQHQSFFSRFLRRRPRRASLITRWQQSAVPAPPKQPLLVASVSLGMAATGAIFQSVALLGPLSLPLTLVIFIPTVKATYHSLWDERRITNPVLTTTRLGVCVVMGFYTIAALDAFLYSLAQTWHGRSQKTWAQSIDKLLASQPAIETAVQRQLLEQTVHQKTALQQQGERNADRVAPYMLAAFVFTLPFYGANRAASFLMTSFGAHMQTLSPLTLRDFATQALEQGIVVKDGRSLATAVHCNVLIIDAALLPQQANPEPILAAIRQQLATAQGIDSDEILVYTPATPNADTITLITQLQLSGRHVCYVGNGLSDREIMETAQLSLAFNSLATLPDNAAQIVFLHHDLATIAQFFAAVDQFQRKQSFNFSTPILFDLVDVTTTVVVHLGLSYSVLFNYSGLLLSTGNVKRPFFPEPPTSSSGSNPILPQES